MPELAFVDVHHVAHTSIEGLSNPTQWVLFFVGLAIVALVAVDVTRSLVVTRWSKTPISRLVRFVVQHSVDLVARRFKSYRRRDSIRVWTAAAMIVGLLTTWLLCFLVGYSLMMRGMISLEIGTAMREAGSSLFTLGFASADRERLSFIDFMAAATGPITIGLMISYLPTIYSAYNTREIEVALLKSRFGEPNWGPEILARHTELGLDDERIRTFWRGWERWAANVTESHTTYSLLLYMRSSRPMRSWLIALLSVLDAAALTVSLRPEHHHAAARVFLRQGIECVNEIAGALRISAPPISSGDSPIQLPKQEFIDACAMIAERGYEYERTPEEAWPYYRNWRRMYESLMYDIAKELDAVPAYWSGTRDPATPQVPPQQQFYEVTDDGTLEYPIESWRVRSRHLRGWRQRGDR